MSRRVRGVLVWLVAGIPTGLVGQEIVEFAIPTPNVFVGGLTVGPDGNVWFTEDTVTDCSRGLCFVGAVGIAQISSTGIIKEFPINGSSQLASPVFTRGMTAGPDGNLWFPEASGFPIPVGPSSAIGRSTTGGTFTDFSSSVSTVSGITAGPDGSLWFTAPAQIGRITTDGVVTTIDLATGTAPNGIATGSDGNLWYADPVGNQIGRLTTGGLVTTFDIPTPNSGPTVITAGPDGALWFIEASANQIGRITTTGVVTEYVIPTPNSQYVVDPPYGIAGGSDGNIWFTEPGGKVGRITTAGVITELVVPAANATPTYIAPSPDGTVWFVDSGPGHPGASDKIGRISPTAQCSDVHTLCLNNGRFAVTASFQSTPEGPSTPATAVPLTNDTGYFWFFDASNIELVAKVLTGCSVNNEYWVFAGGLTDVGVELKVTDILTGAVKSYTNSLGTPFQPTQDTAAFPCP
jgi:streptogramin lyase